MLLVEDKRVTLELLAMKPVVFRALFAMVERCLAEIANKSDKIT